MSSDSSKQHADPSPLNRDAVIDAALALLDTVGVDGLSMRVLADRLQVKAASLYWHLRDKGQLIDLLAEAVLDAVPLPATAPEWRAHATAVCAALTERLSARPASADVVLASLPAVPRSRLTRDLAATLGAAGLADADAAAAALVVAAVSAARFGTSSGSIAAGEPMTLAIDSGSWRVQVRAAAPGTVDLARSVGGGGAPSLEVRPDNRVIVRNRRGGYRGAVELSPERSWYIKVHGGTWNTLLDLRGLLITGMELDSGAGNVTCTLPAPGGIVPITVNSGIVGVTLHRPARTAARANVSGGSVRVRLDGKTLRSAASDVYWESASSRSDDRYELTVHSGCVRVALDDSAPAQPAPPRQAAAVATENAPPPGGHGVSLILDGIERRLAG